MATNETTWKFLNHAWDSDVIPKLSEYIAIPNQSPLYDTEWETNGFLLQAAKLFHDWALKQNVKGLTSEILQLPGKTPLIHLVIPPSHPEVVDSTILMYGHLDKQPPLWDAWQPDLGPYKPVIKDGKLYGRGGADDGYAIFCATLAVKVLQEQGIPHGRIVIVIEASEESGSIHLMDYIDHLKDSIRVPNLIICLDSGAGNYEQLWMTTSLRGMLAANLTVTILNEGQHSGAASGVVPESFFILTQLLGRVVNIETKEFLIKEFLVEIPPNRLKETKNCAETLGAVYFKEIPMVKGSFPISDDPLTLFLNKTWRPTLTITGIAGIPPLDKAGNVLRPFTSAKLSIRLPPTLNPEPAVAALKKALTENVPYGAQVDFVIEKLGAGFDAPPFAEWVEHSMNKASNYFFKKPSQFIGEGGSIPFMGLLKQRFPQAQFVVTGLLGPASNAHGPNEFLHIDFGKKLNACVASIIADHGIQFKKQHPSDN